MGNKGLLAIIAILIVTNILALLGSQNNQELLDDEPNSGVDHNEIVANINGEQINYNQFLAYLEDEFGEQALSELINQEVVSQLADEHNIAIEEGVIDLETSYLSTMEGQLSASELEDMEEEWRETIEYRLILEDLFTRDVDVPEEEIRTYYNQYRNQYNFNHRVQLSHIIVPDRSTANRVIEELDAGASFSALAREYTIDEDTREAGGYLGYYTNTSSVLPEGYFEQATQLEEHTYSEPFQGDGGLAIIYLHQELPTIDLSYEQLHGHMRRKIALQEIDTLASINPKELWSEMNVEWLYD